MSKSFSPPTTTELLQLYQNSQTISITLKTVYSFRVCYSLFSLPKFRDRGPQSQTFSFRSMSGKRKLNQEITSEEFQTKKLKVNCVPLTIFSFQRKISTFFLLLSMI